ncbi:uncharacterized protein TRIADDRAFT_60661 [Trichoplax adhaerens]|uniref:SCP domain-containing protein n=1 Tax=Trichoplax adhaerens TaxID=10228 RepID=B3S913_TRIAD|nr:predicted protein [Trichoplax adhaerens]EDV20714.1 predicted protein [Trichoplax adhaerens]|eukprot:XP_002116655.1 predicted protein [Trichoplax adhaerens]
MSRLIAFVVILAAIVPNGFSSVVIKHRAKSCYEVKEYLQANENGFYNLFDSLGSPYTTYCDFESDTPFVWTLIESFSLQEAQKTANRKGVYVNHPIGECILSWSAFRLSRLRMDTIISSYGTTHYRTTCNFNYVNGTGLANRRDYLRGEICRRSYFHSTWALNRYGQPTYICNYVDYVNVRGTTCRKCTVPFVRPTSSVHEHIDLSIAASHCSKFTPTDSISNEDVFGHYGNANPLFSCTSNVNSTTNWWLGGAYIAEAF